MKRVHVLLLALVMMMSSAMYAQGIKFEKGDWAAALAKAKKQDKLVFVDCYTTWCGPCKWMAKNVFTEKEVGTFYNDNFINVKMDMERGEGLDIAALYEVRAYPTLLFLNGDGELVHQGLGALPKDNFLSLGADAIDPDKQIFTLQNRYDAGEREDELLKNYAKALLAIDNKKYDTVAEEYLDGKDWATEENIEFIFEYAQPSMDSKLFQYVLDHKDKMIAVNGSEDYMMKMEYAAEMDARTKNLDAQDVAAVTEHYKNYFSATEAEAKAKWKAIEFLLYSNKKENPEHIDRLKAESQLYMATNPELTWNQYNALAWELHLLTYDKNILDKCLEWVGTSIDMEENYYNTDTKAAILYKMGSKKEAMKWAKRAIKVAKDAGQDPSDTEKLLEKIKAL